MAKTTRHRFMVNIPKGIAPLVLARARDQNRPVANYLESLVYADLTAAGLLNLSVGLGELVSGGAATPAVSEEHKAAEDKADYVAERQQLLKKHLQLHEKPALKPPAKRGAGKSKA